MVIEESRADRIEEGLEAVWTGREQGETAVETIQRRLEEIHLERPEAILGLLEAENLATLKEGRILLTPSGEAQARNVVRRHRLAERLLADLLEMGEQELEGPACRFEHAISPEMEEKICTLLGHPRECPHGKRIPSGGCCERSERMVESAICALSDLGVGERGTVAYLTAEDPARLHKLSSFGVMPGSVVELLQNFPSLIVRIDETQLALEKKVADNIYVRRTRSEPGYKRIGKIFYRRKAR